MAVRTTEQLERSLALLHEQMLRLEHDATKYGSPEPGGYPAALGLLLGSVRGRLQVMDALLQQARDAAAAAWSPCTHDFGCLDCAEAHEQQEDAA